MAYVRIIPQSFAKIPCHSIIQFKLQHCNIFIYNSVNKQLFIMNLCIPHVNNKFAFPKLFA